MKKNRYALFLVVTSLLTCLLATACVPKKAILSCESPASANTKPAELAVEIYVDGTLSMQGFTQYHNGNYVKTIEELREIFTLTDPITLGGETGRFSQSPLYFRLGETASGETTQKIDESRYREAQFADFYDSTLKVTKLEAAISTPDAVERLTVIVTDLYQAEDNIKVVTEKLKGLLSQSSDMAISLVGIRSKFQGKVYTEKLRDSQFFEYQGFRPFYVLFIGRLDEVHFYTNTLLKRLSAKDDDIRAVIFSSSRFYQEPIVLTRQYQEDLIETLDTDTRRWINSPTSGMSDGKTNVAFEGEQIQPLVFSKTNDISFSLPGSISLKPLSQVLQLSGIETNVQISSSKSRPDPFGKNSSVSNMFSLTKAILEDNRLKFEVQFNLSNAAESSIYFVEAGIIPSATDGLMVQPWWSEWNTSDSEQDGTKTHNLENFTSQLRELTIARIRQNPPTIGKLCYVVQER